jgi:hypothetical protein
MGLIREFYSEIFELPKAAEIKFDSEKDITILHYKIKYSCVNLFFQIIDCIIIPLFTLILVNGNKNFVTSILIIVLGLSSIFSIIQFIYYLINPTQKYINVFHQIIGETAIGIFFASLLNIPIKQDIK